MELLEQIPDLAAAAAAVSGGGLIGGLGISLKARRPAIRVIGVSAENAASMAASVHAGHPIDVPYQDTLADVLPGGIGLQNRWSFDVVRRSVDDHVLVTEREIALAMRFALFTHRILAEGGGAAAIAAALAGKLQSPAGPVVIIVSGGNVDPAVVIAQRARSAEVIGVPTAIHGGSMPTDASKP